jgi:GTP-binding protein Era
MKKTVDATKVNSKFGIITLIGRSNVGKSALLNTLIGTKLAIVTPKPQTTRTIIHGVLNKDDCQAVFVDTPGIFKEKKNLLSGKLTKRAEESLQGIDLIIYVVDPSKSIGAEERYIMSIIRKIKKQKILVINKSDMPLAEKEYLDDYISFGKENDMEIFELSAIANRHVEPLRKRVFELLPEGDLMYPKNQLTNNEPRFWISEIVREKIFLALRKEVPYTTHVEITEIEERPEIILIKAVIFTNEKRYKKMIIGSHGRAIKEIGIAARKELETALNKKIFLELEVEVDRHWEERI